MKFAIPGTRAPNEGDPEPVTRRFGSAAAEARAQQLTRENEMSVRTVTPASGAASLTISLLSRAAFAQLDHAEVNGVAFRYGRALCDVLCAHLPVSIENLVPVAK
jgi:hypothetical protein